MNGVNVQSYKNYSILTGVVGFEPTNGGVKVRCLTTWRRPILLAP